MIFSNLLINWTSLPYHHMMPSSVKRCNVLEEEHTTFQELIDQGKTKQEALQILHLTEVPKTGPENYQWLQQL